MKESKKTGPKETRVKIDGNWQDAVAKAMKKKKPEGGWPDKDKPKKSKG